MKKGGRTPNQGPLKPVERDDVKLARNRCPYCHDDVQAEVAVACQDCLARHHVTCWEELGVCGSCGCQTALAAQTPEATIEAQPRLGSRRRIVLASILVALLLTALSAVGVWGLISADPRGLAATEFLRGQATQKAGNTKVALARYSEALRLDPRLKEAYLYRSRLRVELGDFGSAAEDCVLALRVDSSYVEAHVQHAEALVGLCNYQEAVRTYERILGLPARELLPPNVDMRIDSHAMANLGLAWTYKQMGNLDRARLCAKRALEILPPAHPRTATLERFLESLGPADEDSD